MFICLPDLVERSINNDAQNLSLRAERSNPDFIVASEIASAVRLPRNDSKRGILFMDHYTSYILYLLPLFCLLLTPNNINAQPNKTKILLIGIDAADWEMVRPMAANGELPNLAGLIKSGTSAKIHSYNGISPAYWTSVATGVMPKKHGIWNFTVKDPGTGEDIPYTSNMRRTKAFWNILSEQKINVGVVGWYITWPVEQVNGFMVSSYYARQGLETSKGQQPSTRGTFYPTAPQMVYPENLNDALGQISLKAQENCKGKIREIFPPAVLQNPYYLRITKEDRYRSGIGIRAVKWALMADEIYKEIGVDLYRKFKPQVFAVYLGGLDTVGHVFTHFRKKIHNEMLGIFGNPHKNYYKYIDEAIGEIIREADKDTVIIVLSDHGLMRRFHTNNGIFIISGPNIKKNFRSSEPVNLTDIFPTMLYLLNMPQAKDLDGAVYQEAFLESYLKGHKRSYIQSYGPRAISVPDPIRSRFDDEIRQRLKALGYLN
ncbi:MAG: alkaline phosphatase family protein [Candidatus Schekmanbacteria bacterium]|nr:alkaline phosphatase family protein [Candidatus Schekmanbacteria bacterium]